MHATTSQSSLLSPAQVIRKCGIRKGAFIAEFGCGHGFFTLPLAEAAGPEGKVYAIDIQKAALEVASAKAQNARALNIEYVWGDAEEPLGSRVRDGAVDLVFIANILFQSEQRESIIREAHRILKIQGKMAVVEWIHGKSSLGPSPNLRISPDIIKDLARKSGFEFMSEFDAGSHHFGLLFLKK